MSALTTSVQRLTRVVTQVAALWVALWVALWPARASAQSFRAIFEEGNHAFYLGDYETAQARFEALLEAGVDDPDVHYNLGVTYARRGQHGRAIVELERARRLRPSDTGVSAALEASRAIVGRRHAERDGEAVVEAGAPFGETLFAFLSEDALAWWVLVLVWLGCASVVALFFVRGERTRIALGVAVPLLSLGVLLTGAGLLSRRGAFAAGPTAIVVEDDASLREGPRSDARQRARALEGERAEILARDGDWVRVRLGGGREGWVEDDAVVEL